MESYIMSGARNSLIDHLLQNNGSLDAASLTSGLTTVSIEKHSALQIWRWLLAKILDRQFIVKSVSDMSESLGKWRKELDSIEDSNVLLALSEAFKEIHLFLRNLTYADLQGAIEILTGHIDLPPDSLREMLPKLIILSREKSASRSGEKNSGDSIWSSEQQMHSIDAISSLSLYAKPEQRELRKTQELARKGEEFTRKTQPISDRLNDLEQKWGALLRPFEGKGESLESFSLYQSFRTMKDGIKTNPFSRENIDTWKDNVAAQEALCKGYTEFLNFFQWGDLKKFSEKNKVKIEEFPIVVKGITDDLKNSMGTLKNIKTEDEIKSITDKGREDIEHPGKLLKKWEEILKFYSELRAILSEYDGKFSDPKPSDYVELTDNINALLSGKEESNSALIGGTIKHRENRQKTLRDFQERAKHCVEQRDLETFKEQIRTVIYGFFGDQNGGLSLVFHGGDTVDIPNIGRRRVGDTFTTILNGLNDLTLDNKNRQLKAWIALLGKAASKGTVNSFFARRPGKAKEVYQTIARVLKNPESIKGREEDEKKVMSPPSLSKS